jgi:hypothetical protein
VDNGVMGFLAGGYEAFNRREFERLLAMVVDDFVWNEAAEVPGRKLCTGRDEFAAYMREFTSAWDDFSWEILGGEALDDETVIARVRGTGHSHKTGSPVEVVVHHVWRLRDGKLARMDAFIDGRRAREHAAPVRSDR